MVQDGAHIRRRDAQDFMACYDFACARQESAPLLAVKMNLDKGMLDFRGDRIKLTDWPPILRSICINKHLHHIAISSTYQASPPSGDTDRRYYNSGSRKRIPAIRSKDMTFKLCKALEECLTVSSNLKTLQLNGLPLRERDLITLTKGFSKSVSLENLSLANCPISDDGLEVICQSVKYSASIRTVDFTGCNLTWRGAEHMANIIKHQGMQRHGTAWAESLRYRKPQFEGMGGLRRVTLNCNMLIGDRGAAALANEVTEDLWVKALDLQRCGLSNEGARRLLEALKANTSLCVLDIRSNPLIDKVLIKTILERVLMNTNVQPKQYCWIKPAALQPQKASCLKRWALPGSVRGKTTFRKAARKGTSPAGRRSGDAQTQEPFSGSGYVPWRAAARAGRQRGLPPGDCVMGQRFQGAATVKVNESDSEGEEDDERDKEEVVVEEVSKGPPSPGLQDGVIGRKFEHMQMELKECRLRLAEERRARLKAESRLMEFELETARLRDQNLSLSEALTASGSASASPAVSALEDETVLESIESSFTKFHAFLDLLKDAGLGQLASMAGLDKSDFHRPGRPQLSSTVGPYSGGAASPTGGEHRGDRASVGMLSSMRAGGVPPAPQGRPADITPPRSPFSVREFLLEGRLSDLTFDPTSGPTGAAGLNGEEEPDTYSKLESRRDSSSERSFRSQNSFDVAPLSKTFRTRSSRRRSSKSNNSGDLHSGDLHSSDGSLGHSYSSSYARSHSSHGSGTHGGLIAGLISRLSASDAMSDRAESAGSVGSRYRRKERLAVLERNSCPERDTLQQFRALGVQSEDESF